MTSFENVSVCGDLKCASLQVVTLKKTLKLIQLFSVKLCMFYLAMKHFHEMENCLLIITPCHQEG